MSIHYDYVVEALKTQIPENRLKNATFLDFGCGAGHIVERGLDAGLNFYGADPYPESRSDHYKEQVDNKELLDGRIHIIENDTLPFPDNYFDAICSNMVFEHIPDITKPMSEIKRVLKPNGVFLALFPTADTAWEGHVNLYFAHWFKPYSKLGNLYLKYAKTLGFGKKNDDMTASEWANHYQKYLREYCFYRPMKEIDQVWRNTFHNLPESLAAEHMIYRVSNHRMLSKTLPFLQNKLGRIMLGKIYHLRGGRILLIHKNAEN